MNQFELDEKNQALVAQISEAWAGREGLRTGDFVRYPDRTLRRVAYCHSDGPRLVQTSDGGSFHISTEGAGTSFSGTLRYGFRREFLRETNETLKGVFWFFSHGLAGAGRGRFCQLPCKIYELRPFFIDRETAEEHPAAKQSAEFWGKDDPNYEKCVLDLMYPPVMLKPDIY